MNQLLQFQEEDEEEEDYTLRCENFAFFLYNVVIFNFLDISLV